MTITENIILTTKNFAVALSFWEDKYAWTDTKSLPYGYRSLGMPIPVRDKIVPPRVSYDEANDEAVAKRPCLE